MNSSIKAKPKAKAGSDSDDDFVVKENKFQDDEKRTFDMENELRKRNQDEDEDENHGQLVKNILESKKQREFGSELNENKGDFVRFIMIVIILNYLFNFNPSNLETSCTNGFTA